MKGKGFMGFCIVAAYCYTVFWAVMLISLFGCNGPAPEPQEPGAVVVVLDERNVFIEYYGTSDFRMEIFEIEDGCATTSTHGNTIPVNAEDIQVSDTETPLWELETDPADLETEEYLVDGQVVRVAAEYEGKEVYVAWQ